MRGAREHLHGQHGRNGVASPLPTPGKRTLTEALGPGEGLPDKQRSLFEQSLGRDLSAVRVHTNDVAAGEADRAGARAYATQQDIVFARGEYDPGSQRSMHLLAHEVAHTAQQQGAGEPGAAGAAGALTTTQPGDVAEREADAVATAMVAGKPAVVSAHPMSIARKTRDEGVGEPPSAPEATGGVSEPSVPEAARDTGEPGASGSPAASGDGGAPGTAKDEEIGELSAQQVGVAPWEGAFVGPDVPVRDTEAGKQEIAGAGQQLSSEVGADGAGAPAAADAGGNGSGGGGGVVDSDVTASITAAQNDARAAISQSEAESAAFKAEMGTRRDQFEAEQHATMLEQLKTMSSIEKRQTLQEMGYDPKAVKKLKDAELDGIIEGKMDTEQRKAKILGMTPEELAALPPARKIQYLVDLGIDRGDLDKAGEGKATRLFDDVMKVAHVPGQHEVKIQIKGGLFGKSWVVKVTCDAEGESDIQAQKEGGFLSKLWGWVKIALPVILTVLAPLTAGASLIVLAVYQTVTAIKSGDWLGAVMGAAAALGGVSVLMVAKGAITASSTFAKIAQVATKVKDVAQKAELAMVAAKAKNAGSLLGALAAGAAAFAKFSSSSADKFAQTMTQWSQRLEKWSKIVSGGEKVVQGIKKGDPLAAIGGAFDTALAVVGPKSAAAKTLGRASKITGLVNTGKRALEAKPPSYAGVAEAALGIAAQLKEDRRIDDASRLVSSANRLKQALDKRDSDPAALVDAAFGLAEAIQLAKHDVENDEQKDGDGKPVVDADRKAILDRYERAGRIVRSAGAVLKAATAKPRPNYLGALDAATQLIAELTDSKQIDAAAVVTSKLDAWTRAVSSKDEKAIMKAGLALGEAIDGLRTVIAEEHASSKQAAEAKLAPGDTLPDDGGASLPPGPTASDVAVANDAAPTPVAYEAVPSDPAERAHGPMADESQYVLVSTSSGEYVSPPPPLSADESSALERMRGQIAAAERLLSDSSQETSIDDQDKATIRQALARARAALADYQSKRSQGSTRKEALGGIAVASGAIVADDATGVGTLDDPLLVVAGIAALAVLMFTSAPPGRDAMEQAWRDLAGSLEALRDTLSAVLMAAKVGEQVRGLTGEVIIHLARILGTTVARRPPDHQGDPDRDRKHWWTEIKNFLQQIKDKGLSPRQLQRELLKKFTPEQLAEIREALQKAAEMMGEQPPFAF
jgi:Domain of unknown function (DUF4157)